MLDLKLDYKKAKDTNSVAMPGIGGYVAKIISVEDHPQEKYLQLELDISEGEYKDCFTEAWKTWGNWPAMGSTRVYYNTEKAIEYGFMPFIGAVQESNGGFGFNNDEKTLKGKTVGIIIGEREYLSRDGEVKIAKNINRFRSAEAIREGKFRMPKLRELPEDQKPKSNPLDGFTEVDDSDLPF